MYFFGKIWTFQDENFRLAQDLLVLNLKREHGKLQRQRKEHLRLRDGDARGASPRCGTEPFGRYPCAFRGLSTVCVWRSWVPCTKHNKF